MPVVLEFAIHWGSACEARRLTKLFAEMPVPDRLQSVAGRAGREFLAASALAPAELDDVLSEIVLLTVTDAGEPVWRLVRVDPSTVAAAIGGAWTAHFARSFFRATSLRPARWRVGSPGPEPQRFRSE